MPLLDDLGTVAVPPKSGRRTYTAPPRDEHLPSFLQGLEPVSDDELQAEWKKQEEKQPSLVGSRQSLAEERKPGDLLTRLSLGGGLSLSDAIGKYAAAKDALRAPAGMTIYPRTSQSYWDEKASAMEAKAREAAPSETAQAQALAPSEAIQDIFRKPKSTDERIASAQKTIDQSAPMASETQDQLASEEMQHPASFITGALRSGIGNTPLGKQVMGAIDIAGNPFGIRSSEDTEKERLADQPGTVAQIVGGAGKAITELGLSALVPEALGAEANAANIFTAQETINQLPNIAENPLDPKIPARILLSRELGKGFGLAEEGAARTVTEKGLSDAAEPIAQIAAKAGTSAAIMAAQPLASHVIEGSTPTSEEIATGAMTGAGFGLMGIKGKKDVSDHNGNVSKMIEALLGQESGGNSDAVSPTGVKGKYQMTEANTKEWTKKFLGKEVPRDRLIGTPEEDIVGRGQIQEYYENNLKKYGDPRRAARETALDWYGREPHSVGPSPRSYAKQVVNRFDKAEEKSVQSLVVSRQSVADHEGAPLQPEVIPPAQTLPSEPVPPAPEEIKAQIDQAAHEAATSPSNDLPEPTPLQQQSGNYKKGHVNVAGFDISVENPAGSVRKGIASDGKPWETQMKDHYGYIKGSTGADGDHLDAFIGPDPLSKKVFVVDQVNAEDESRPFDEHKVILGATDANDAREIYKRNFSDDAEPRIQSLTETTPEALKSWIKEGNPREPFAERQDLLRIKNSELSTDQHATTGEQSAAGTQELTQSGGTEEIPQTDIPRESPQPRIDKPLPEEIQRQPLAIHSLGDETRIELTGKTPLKARYAVVEADDLQASHNEETFSPNPNYPERTQTRDYTGTKEEQAKVIGNAENFKPQYIVTDDPSPVNGPPMVDGSGNVAGGNGRTMSIKRVYNSNPEGAKAFKDLQIKKAANFGLDPDVVRGMKKPVIIRQLDETDLRSGGGSKLVDDLNDTPTQQSDALTQGVTTGRRMSAADVTEIASALQEGNSIRDALSLKASTDRVRDVLRRNGTITRINAPRYLKADGTFTSEGVNLIEGAMMGRVIDDVGTAKIVQGLSGNYAKKITEALHPLSVIEGAPAEWSLKSRLDKVLKYIAARGDMPDKDFRSQPSMIEGQDIILDGADRAILNALDSPKIKTFKNFANDYAERIGGDIFHPNITPEEALAETVKVMGGQTGINGGTLALEIFPGAGQLAKAFEDSYEQDIKPKLITAARGITEAASDIQKTFAPATRGPAAEETKYIMRDRMAELARSRDIAETELENAHKALAKLPKEAQYDFIDRSERGIEQLTPELEAISKAIAPIFESRMEKVHELAPGKLRDLIDNYFPHIWEDPKKATEVFAQIYAKRPFEGTKAFLKKRVHEYFSDGIVAGLKPVSDNPIDLVMLKAHEVDRFIMAHEVLNEMKERGLLKYVSVYEKAPTGYVKIDDKVSTVYGNPEIPVWESHDLHIMGKLNTIAESLGIDNERKPNIGGNRRGYAQDSDPTKVVTKFGGSERTLAHEIGHALDFKYGLKEKLVRNKEFKQELRDLADQRLENGVSQRYVRKGEEKMAVMLESYIWAPEIFKSVAPKTYAWFNDFLSTHPELKALTEIKPSLTALDNTSTVNAGGMVIRGYHYAPEEAARLVNNYLSPGLREKSGIFRAYLGIANTLNQAQLGLSAFHLGFVTVDSMTSGLALGVYEAMHGEVVAGSKTAVSSLTAPVTNLLTGSKVLKEWVSPGSQGEEIGLIANAMQMGGGRGKMDNFYRTSVTAKMIATFKNGTAIGRIFNVLRLPLAGIELAAKPVMEYIVPRMKAGAFANMARFELERNQAELDNMSPADRQRRVRELMSNAWDSVDNRLGQLVYDNLFWSKATKDLAMASVRSVGWNIGTFRELGGGLVDYGKAIRQIASGHARDAEFTHRMSYVTAAPIMAGLVGATIGYLMTGDYPKELKDYFFPKSGGKDEQGNDARVSLPSYMKDVFAYYNDIHDAFALKKTGDALRTVLNKANPEIGFISEMLQNKDYYGAKIVGDNDNFLEKLGEHAGSAFIPFGVRGLVRNIQNEGLSAKAVLPFIGVTPAPKALNESDASKLMQQYLDESREKGGFERTDRSDARNKAIHAFRSGKPAEARKIIREGVKAGVLTSFTSESGARQGEHVGDDIGKIMKESKMSYMQAKFKESLDLRKAMNVYEKATPGERRQLRPYLFDKWRNKSKEGANITRDELAKLRERFVEVKDLPY